MWTVDSPGCRDRSANGPGIHTAPIDGLLLGARWRNTRRQCIICIQPLTISVPISQFVLDPAAGGNRIAPSLSALLHPTSTEAVHNPFKFHLLENGHSPDSLLLPDSGAINIALLRTGVASGQRRYLLEECPAPLATASSGYSHGRTATATCLRFRSCQRFS